MRMHIQPCEGLLIMTPMERNIDASVEGDFKGALHEAIDQGNTQLILDLSNVEFLDSSGLGVMVSALKRIGNNGDLVFCGINEQVANVLGLTRLDRVFNIYPDSEEACKALTRAKESAAPEGEKAP